ncbi:MAG: hypothetical protein RL213_395 [Bacteroidota bacterium]|jgi:hypothetical protein
MRRRLFLLLHSVLCFSYSFAQEDFTWWNELHGWDGVTPWNRYMTLSAKYFGPNALAVPEVRKGVPDSVGRIDVLAGGHFSRGDRTLDGDLSVTLPFCRGCVSLEASVVPVEYYSYDTLTRDLRSSRDKDGKGRAGGDFCFSTLVRIVRDREYLPDVALEMAFRAPSGTRLEAARFTNTPGYHFDLSFGKPLCNGRNCNIRAYGMLGYYSYQTFDVDHLQDGCFLYGAGTDVTVKSWLFTVQSAGYSGYLDNGDRPMVFRAELRKTAEAMDALVRVQIGMRDFEYRSVHVGVSWKPAKVSGR